MTTTVTYKNWKYIPIKTKKNDVWLFIKNSSSTKNNGLNNNTVAIIKFVALYKIFKLSIIEITFKYTLIYAGVSSGCTLQKLRNTGWYK